MIKPLIHDHFYPQAEELRDFFEEQFVNPYSLQAKRFVWDYWHVPHQFSLLRTPAYHYFPEKMYMRFHRHLVQWGRSQLGCWDISPPWLSCYIHGSRQEMHTDSHHGLWAFVYSLSPQQKFSGGETFLLNSDSLSVTQSQEKSHLLKTIPPKMNRLSVFDPQTPHGVTEVRGSMNPADGRLVIHGWFTEPKTYKVGPLPKGAVAKKLNEATLMVQDLASQFPLFKGVLAIHLTIAKSGKVKLLSLASNTIKGLTPEDKMQFLKSLKFRLMRLQFSSAKTETFITLPLVFA
jgi:hypothetical protein